MGYDFDEGLEFEVWEFGDLVVFEVEEGGVEVREGVEWDAVLGD